jgi:hypothetical protein
MAQDRAPAAESTDRHALPDNPGGEHRPTDTRNEHWERSNPHQLSVRLVISRSRCQPHAVGDRMPEEAKARSNALDMLTSGRCSER